MSRSKKRAKRYHARRRARERYRLLLDRIDLKTLVDKIQNNEGEFVYKSSNRTTLWKLKCKGQAVLVVYDKLRSEIVTFLPLDYADRLEKRRAKLLTNTKSAL